MTNSATNKYLASVIALGLLLSVVLVLGAGEKAPAGADAPTAGESQGDRRVKSDLLTVAHPIGDLQSGPGRGRHLGTLGEIREHATKVRSKLPLPPGGTLADVGEERAANSGGIGAADMEFVMQFNAMCDWFVHVDEGARDDTTMRILRQIPKWSAFRVNAVGEHATTIIDAFEAGDSAPLKEDIAANC